MISTILKWLTGGVLDRVLKSVDSAIDNETERQKVRADAIKTYVQSATEARIAAMQSRAFWYVWLLFAAPLGFWWALVLIDTALVFVDWGVPDLPLSIRPWADTIFASVFGSGAAVGSIQIIASAIRGRR